MSSSPSSAFHPSSSAAFCGSPYTTCRRHDHTPPPQPRPTARCAHGASSCHLPVATWFESSRGWVARAPPRRLASGRRACTGSPCRRPCQTP
eukprot:5393100-Prymnesium_polylepis.2